MSPAVHGCCNVRTGRPHAPLGEWCRREESSLARQALEGHSRHVDLLLGATALHLHQKCTAEPRMLRIMSTRLDGELRQRLKGVSVSRFVKGMMSGASLLYFTC